MAFAKSLSSNLGFRQNYSEHHHWFLRRHAESPKSRELHVQLNDLGDLQSQKDLANEPSNEISIKEAKRKTKIEVKLCPVH